MALGMICSHLVFKLSGVQAFLPSTSCLLIAGENGATFALLDRATFNTTFFRHKFPSPIAEGIVAKKCSRARSARARAKAQKWPHLKTLLTLARPIFASLLHNNLLRLSHDLLHRLDVVEAGAVHFSSKLRGETFGELHVLDGRWVDDRSNVKEKPSEEYSLGFPCAKVV